MLVLSRRANESIQIGEGITVSVLRIDGERVRIGITAPTEVLVVRSELLAAVADENQRAVAQSLAPSFTLPGWNRKTSDPSTSTAPRPAKPTPRLQANGLPFLPRHERVG